MDENICGITRRDNPYFREIHVNCQKCSFEPGDGNCLKQLGISESDSTIVINTPEFRYEIDRKKARMLPVFFTGRIAEITGNVLKEYELDTGAKIRIIQTQEDFEKIYVVIPPEYNISDDEARSLVNTHRELLSVESIEPVDFSTIRKIIADFAGKKLNQILKNVFIRHTAGFGLLEHLFSDPGIQDVYLYSSHMNIPLQITYMGEEMTTNVFLSREEVEGIVTKLRLLSERPFSEGDPILDAELEDFKVRVNAITKPLSQKGIALAFRKHKQAPWTLPELIVHKMLSPEIAGLLSFLVDAECSVLITGSRGAGKTSLLGSLLLEIPSNRRILVIEDTPEIPVDVFQELGWKIQGMLTRPSVSTTSFELPPSEALRAALRMGESVLVIGEVRGEEAGVLYEAMRVGTAGNSVLGTIHGSSVRDVIERVVYDLGVSIHSFKATDVVVVCTPVRMRGRSERVRMITEIAEIRKDDGDFKKIVSFDQKSGYNIDLSDSGIISRTAKKWGLEENDIMRHIRIRGEIKRELVERSEMFPEAIKSDFVANANKHFWYLNESLESLDEIMEQWKEWLRKEVKDVVSKNGQTSVGNSS